MSSFGEMRCVIEPFCISHNSYSMKVEYLVVAFDKDQKNAKLSLRQSEILAKLGSICNDLSDEAGEKSVSGLT